MPANWRGSNHYEVPRGGQCFSEIGCSRTQQPLLNDYIVRLRSSLNRYADQASILPVWVDIAEIERVVREESHTVLR